MDEKLNFNEGWIEEKSSSGLKLKYIKEDQSNVYTILMEKQI